MILGLGQYPQGSGVVAALYFARRGDRVLVVDYYYTPTLDANVKQLKKFKNVSFLFNTHAVKEVGRMDMVVRHPRARANEPELVEARRLGIPIASDQSIFLNACPARVIGITGTRGKSTTTTLIYELLKANHGTRAHIGGNILISPLTFVSHIRKNDVVVLEMSSFQLEGLGEAGVSPAVAVWTNLMRDHLNAYPTMAEYAEAKAQIFRHQTPHDTVFLPGDRFFDSYAQEAPGAVVRFGKKGSQEEAIVKSVKMKLLGQHNQMNAMTAVAVALHMGVPIKTIKKVLTSFKGLPNRLELIATKKGVNYMNDTTATTPDATIAAIQSLPTTPCTLHLIFGGADKELEFDQVAGVLKKSHVNIALLPGTAHDKITKAFHAHRVAYTDVPDLREALKMLKARAVKGDTILLSPGCASFGLFKNEFDRGEQFKKLVESYA